MFQELAHRLPAEIETVGVRAPGRESRWSEPPFTDAGAMVEAFLDGAADQLVAPYAFLGYCTGTLVALDSARSLRRRGRPGPQMLFVLSAATPDGSAPFMAFREEDDAIQRLLRIGGTIGRAAEHPELLRIVRRMVEADFAMFDSYAFRPDAPLDVPISALAGRDDVTVRPADLLGWQAHTTAEFTMRLVTGAHHLLRTGVADVAGVVGADVRRLLRTPAEDPRAAPPLS